MASDALIGVPWRAGDPWRERSWAVVRSHLDTVGYPIAELDSGDTPFNRAASRNLAATCTDGVVILHDADMIAPTDAYHQLVERAAHTGRLVVGYSEYRALTARATAKVHAGGDPWRAGVLGVTVDWSVGGIVALTVDAWQELSGMDERFQAWGCEDTAFAHAAGVLLGPIERLTTPAVHLWHPHGSGHANEADNADLLARYTAAATPDEMRALLNERRT